MTQETRIVRELWAFLRGQEQMREACPGKGVLNGKQRAKFMSIPVLLAPWNGIGSGRSRAGRELIQSSHFTDEKPRTRDGCKLLRSGLFSLELCLFPAPMRLSASVLGYTGKQGKE